MRAPAEFVEKAIKTMREALPRGRAVVACSGGVDSTVCAVLAHRAFSARANAVFLDTGFMRADEAPSVEKALAALGIPLEVVPVATRFFQALAGVTDPEEKRRRFRETFYAVLAEILAQKGAQALVQGTIAADVAETQAAVKTHHNVLDLGPEVWPKKLVVLEPLRALLKPEVRELARYLGLPQEFPGRRPFPGPGLAVRVVGEVTPERVELLRQATRIAEEETADLPAFQAFPTRGEGHGSAGRNAPLRRRFGPAVHKLRGRPFLRALGLPWEKLRGLVARLLRELPTLGRVLYELTPKPPATIEWE